MNIPSKAIGMATVFASYEDADKMAARIAADDSEWQYGVVRLTTNRFVISVYDNSEDDFCFLGYL